ncbi:MAG TPA: vWA domain-containing protein [Phycisphaerales bacterium]|nr:vWA domain-containing protein [Phycisphaerales bacterium]
MPNSPASTAELEARLVAVEAELKRAASTRRRNRLLLGVSISIVIHLTLLFILNHLYRMIPGGSGDGTGSYEIALRTESELSNDTPGSLDDLQPESVSAVAETSPPTSRDLLQAAVPAAKVDLSSSGGGLSLSGEGGASGGGSEGMGGEGNGLGGSGGAGTSFFGITSKGTRIAYILDRSASMNENRKLQSALNELAHSVETLPDFSYFYVVLFSSNTVTPPNQEGWMQARKPVVRNFIRWLNTVEPGGGTEPKDAFIQVLSLDTRPDVIFFLTDGELQHFTPEDLSQLNSRGRKVIINTIGFDTPDTADVLKRMASDSGGVYRYVHTAP